MNLTLHLVRKDWLRARPALVAWYALIAGKAWCVWQLSRSADATSNFDLLESFVNSLNGLEAVVGTLLAARLALEDPVMSVNAFWTTRPIGPGRLLRAKSLAASLFFLAAPIVLLAPVWIAAGFSPSEFFAAAADWALLQGLFVALGLLAGALARDLGQAFLAAPLLGLALLGIATWLRREPAPDVWQSTLGALTVAASGFALACRLRRRGLVFGCVVVGLLIVAGFGLPAPSQPERLLAWPDAPVTWRDRDTRGVAARVWRFIPSSPAPRSMVVQCSAPRPGLLPDPDADRQSPRFLLFPDQGAPALPLVPGRVGTVRTASLHVTRWRFTLPAESEAVGLAARFAAEPAASSGQHP